MSRVGTYSYGGFNEGVSAYSYSAASRQAGPYSRAGYSTRTLNEDPYGGYTAAYGTSTRPGAYRSAEPSTIGPATRPGTYSEYTGSRTVANGGYTAPRNWAGSATAPGVRMGSPMRRVAVPSYNDVYDPCNDCHRSVNKKDMEVHSRVCGSVRTAATSGSGSILNSMSTPYQSRAAQPKKGPEAWRREYTGRSAATIPLQRPKAHEVKTDRWAGSSQRRYQSPEKVVRHRYAGTGELLQDWSGAHWAEEHVKGINQMRLDQMKGPKSKEPELVLKENQKGAGYQSGELRAPCPICGKIMPMKYLEKHAELCRKVARDRERLEDLEMDLKAYSPAAVPVEFPDEPERPREASPMRAQSPPHAVAPVSPAHTQTSFHGRTPASEHATQTSFREAPVEREILPPSHARAPEATGTLPPGYAYAVPMYFPGTLPGTMPGTMPGMPPYANLQVPPQAPERVPLQHALPDLEAMIHFVDRVRGHDTKPYYVEEDMRRSNSPRLSADVKGKSVKIGSPQGCPPGSPRSPGSPHAGMKRVMSAPWKGLTAHDEVIQTYDTRHEEAPIELKTFTPAKFDDQDGSWAMGGGGMDEEIPMAKKPSVYETSLMGESAPSGPLVQCENCERKFAASRIKKHQAICKKASTNQLKRGVFDSTNQRLNRPESGYLGPNDAFGSSGGGSGGLKAPEPEKYKLDPTTRQPDGRYKCPYCERCFAEETAIRHIPGCKKRMANDKARMSFKN